LHVSPVCRLDRGGDLPGTEWLFPIIETLHILSLTVVFGSIAMIDVRLIGQVNRKAPFTKLNRELVPWTWWAFAAAVVSGSILPPARFRITCIIRSSWSSSRWSA
jgi:hypothetical protein